jgi:holo-[acyl-carrier protein] synthase
MNVPMGLMVIGLGSDLCNITRIQNSIDRFGDRFLNRLFTDVERAKADRRVMTRAATYAKRFAAKEACSKALGTGFRQGVFFKDMGVVNLPSGAPTLALTGGAAARLAQITPAGYQPHIHLTLTDDDPWAQAIVLITASKCDA